MAINYTINTKTTITPTKYLDIFRTEEVTSLGQAALKAQRDQNIRPKAEDKKCSPSSILN